MEFGCQIGRDGAGDDIVPIGMRPLDKTANQRPALDEAVSDQPVQIQLQPILQAYTFALPGHSSLSQGKKCGNFF
jgi:hypothetical protein